MADGDSFPILNAGKPNQARRKVCHNCTNRQKKRDRIQRGIGVPDPRPPEALQTNKKRQWSKEDDKYLREHIDDGYEAIAIALGRSVSAIYTRRERLGLATVRKKHRVDKPWRIQSPP